MSYQLVALDLDGTLTNSKKEVTPRTRDAVLRAQRRGARVVLASGRPASGVETVARGLEMDRFGGFLLSFNGCRVTACGSGEELFSLSLPPEAAPRVQALARQCGVCAATYRGRTLLVNDPDDRYMKIEERVSLLTPERMEDLGAVDFAVPRFLLSADPPVLDRAQEVFRDALEGPFHVLRSEPFFLEVLPAGVDKAAALEKLLARLGVPREGLLACGDSYNDLTMLRYAGRGVAMGNACAAAKEAAGEVTASNDEDGVALVLEKYLL